MVDDDASCDGVLALVGLRGTGKTTLGLQCAHRLGVPFVDLDAVLETLGPTIVRLGKTPVGPEPVGQLLERIGLEVFRWLENRALHGLFLGSADLERPDDERARAALAGWDVSRTRVAVGRRRLEPNCVLATGGGVLELESNRHLLRDRAHVVWLDAPTPVLARRIAADPTHRPSVSGTAGATAQTEIETLRERREPFFVEVSEAVLHSDAEVDVLAGRLVDLWSTLSND